MGRVGRRDTGAEGHCVAKVGIGLKDGPCFNSVLC